MASFAKRADSWRADVNRLGVRKTATFDSLAQAKTWALHEESHILSTSGGERVGVRTTILLRAALERFMREVLPSRKSYKKEWTRLNAIKVKRPSNPPPRVRRISDDEVRLIQSALGTCEGTPTTTKALVG